MMQRLEKIPNPQKPRPTVEQVDDLIENVAWQAVCWDIEENWQQAQDELAELTISDPYLMAVAKGKFHALNWMKGMLINLRSYAKTDAHNEALEKKNNG